jgi:hypothetical protein
MSGSHVVAGFLPTTNGLHFSNSFPPGPTVKLGPLDPRWVGIGDASSGLCGGMSWYTREQFDAKKPIPADTTPPANGSPLFQAIVRRQVLSLDWMKVPLRFYALSAWRRPKPGERAVDRDWSKITGFLDGDKMRIIGLIRQSSWNPFGLTQNHQVLAYGYSDDGTTRKLRIYDPNHPNDDTVTLEITDAGLKQSTGEQLLDLFDAG